METSNSRTHAESEGLLGRVALPAALIIEVLVAAGLAWLFGWIGGGAIDLPAILGAIAIVAGTAAVAAVALLPGSDD